MFAIVDERGLVLRHVPNTKIENLKLERVVSEDVHQDTNEEKAQEIIDLIQDRQETIDSHQFSSISENAEAIKELKEK